MIVPAAEANLNERDAGLHKSTGHQAAGAEAGPAVGIPDRVGLVGELEGFRIRRVHHL